MPPRGKSRGTLLGRAEGFCFFSFSRNERVDDKKDNRGDDKKHDDVILEHSAP